MENTQTSAMRIYTSSTDRIGTKLFYEHLVHQSKKRGIAGVTVYRGVMGYGVSSRHISTSKFWELTEKLPITIEMVDSDSALEEFYKFIEPEITNLEKGILITIEPVRVIIQKQGVRSRE